MQQRAVTDVHRGVHRVGGGASVGLAQQRGDAANRDCGRLQIGRVLVLVEDVFRADDDVGGRDLRVIADVDQRVAGGGVVRERAASGGKPDRQRIGARILRLRVDRVQVNRVGGDYREIGRAHV